MAKTLTEKLREAVARDPYWWLRAIPARECWPGEDGVYRIGILQPAESVPHEQTTHAYEWTETHNGLHINIKIDPESLRKLNDLSEETIRSLLRGLFTE